MRKNLPVTNQEYVLKDGVSLVSQTDTKGRITYCNAAFIEASGFTEEELIGKPHNLVRHPDMPEEAFGDLWETLKLGLPWNGVIKNRRKNGDHYWVMANATPVREGDSVVGYMSVRNKPSRQQIEEASRLYADMQSGQARGVAIRRGMVVSTGLVGKLGAWRRASLGLRIGVAMSSLIGLVLALGVPATMHAQGNMRYCYASITALAVLISLLTWSALRASVVRPLKRLVDDANRMAGGDLTANLSSDRTDDMGQLQRALQQMNVNLRSVIGDARANVGAILTATREIASGNMDLSERTAAQASSLEQTAASMEEFASTVRQNADNAVQANQLTSSASDVAGKGGEAVRSVGKTMDEINASAKRIVDIISLIDGIAFQTNILALNAAVEAARAGEQGRGFAVVAGEVRNLAQRSTAAAKEIKALIDDSAEKVDIGNRLVGNAMTTMDDILGSVQRVTSIVNEISTASREQSTGIEQVNQAVAQMDQVTQQNAALVEQSAAAAQSLEEQVQQLARSVAVFKTGAREDAVMLTATAAPKLLS
jgi:aerotaxis receptor